MAELSQSASLFCLPSQTSSRNRALQPDGRVQALGPSSRGVRKQPCPHTLTLLRPTRQVLAEKKQCPICLEDFFSTPPGRDQVQVVPARMECKHEFCLACIETHRSSKIKCPLPYCKIDLPVQPDTCELCAYWVRSNSDSLLLTVRATEMTSSIKFCLQQMALEDSFFAISKATEQDILSHVRRTLSRFEWQYHPGSDLAELLDPFLAVVDPSYARQSYPELTLPPPDPTIFPVRENDPDDYPPGQEPWIAAFFRQWALEYERDHGEEKTGWGAWGMKRKTDPTGLGIGHISG